MLLVGASISGATRKCGGTVGPRSTMAVVLFFLRYYYYGDLSLSNLRSAEYWWGLVPRVLRPKLVKTYADVAQGNMKHVGLGR